MVVECFEMVVGSPKAIFSMGLHVNGRRRPIKVLFSHCHEKLNLIAFTCVIRSTHPT